MKKILAFALASVMLVPVLVAAQTGVNTNNDTGVNTSNSTTGVNTNNSTGVNTNNSKPGIQNPLKGVESLGGFFYKLANFVYSLSYAVIAFFLIWSGFKFVAAQGNDTKLQDAKRTFYYTIIGAVLLIGAQVITEVVRNVINEFTNNPI